MPRALLLGALVAGALFLALPQTSSATVTVASDNFNRANGSLGAGWTDMAQGGLSISSQAVAGTQASGNSGDIRTGEAYSGDQFSQIELTSAPVGGGQWIGAAVRAQSGGQSLYVGIYYGNFGSPELMLFKLLNGGWTQLGSTFQSGALPAGTQLNLAVTGSTLSFSENGVVEITATDTSLTGGAPAIMAFGTTTADNWAGGNTTATGSSSTIGGTVSGLSGTVVLEDNGGNDLSVSANGAFTFTTPLAQGSAYAVTVATQPTGQSCSVTNGSGTVGSANVTNVSVSCSTQGGGGGTTHSIGGTVSGLSGTVVLEDNGGNDLSVGANGAFTFTTPLAQGSAYAVTVATQPAGQTCTVANPSGTVGTADVTNVAVLCSSGTFSVHYVSTDANNVATYSFTSANDGDGTQALRVLAPTHPAAGVAHNFLYVLPVEAGLNSIFGDGLETLASLDAEDQYNVTIVEPTFAIDSWYANNPNDANLQYETFMTSDLVPWVKANLATSGTEQNWLLGFSKSGYGAEDLILKHPDLFQLAAAWDFPADMGSYNELGTDPAANYGTDANFQANYHLTSAFVDAHKAPFLATNRLWIGGYFYYQPEVADYDALLSSEGIQHSTTMASASAHSWGSGWVPAALAALAQDSTGLGSTTPSDTLTFNTEGGSAVANVSGLDGTTVTLPGGPTRAGYTFSAWNSAADGSGTAYAAGATYTLRGSATLYAQWTANATDTLTFNTQGGSAVANVSGLDGTTVTLPGAPTRAGYLFNGWFAAPSGGSALTSPYTLAGSRTLYAQWTPAPSTSVLIPTKGASLSGSTYLDASASNATSVSFLLFGGSFGFNAPVVCTATPTLYGWLCAWNTATVPNGTYTLVSLASNAAGSAPSSGVAITVNNLHTTLLAPSGGATLSGTTAVLDASAAGPNKVSGVTFVVSGGSLSNKTVGAAVPTAVGWIALFNTTGVPNGTYTLQSVATDSGGATATSPGITVSIAN